MPVDANGQLEIDGTGTGPYGMDQYYGLTAHRVFPEANFGALNL
jgi:hypothetical protein